MKTKPQGIMGWDCFDVGLNIGHFLEGQTRIVKFKSPDNCLAITPVDMKWETKL